MMESWIAYCRNFVHIDKMNDYSSKLIKLILLKNASSVMDPLWGCVSAYLKRAW